MKNATLNFVSNVIFFACLGSIIDFIAGTGIVIGAIGLVLGIVVATIIYITKKRKGEKK